MSLSDKIILTVLAVFAILVYLIPLVAGVCLERQEQKKRGELDPGKARYDERQKLIRLEAGVHALYALGAYLVVWLVLEFADVLHWEARTVALLPAGLLLAFVVWNSECILRGAMLGFNQRKNESSQIIVYFAQGLCWAVAGGANWEAMSGSLGAVLQMLMGGSFLLQGCLMLHTRRERKRSERGIDARDGEA